MVFIQFLLKILMISLNQTYSYHTLQIGIKAMAVKKNFSVVIKIRLKDVFIIAKTWKQPKYPLTAK